MKTILFFPRIDGSFRASYAPLGILSIASFLNANGHEAVVYDRFFEKDSLNDVFEKHRPDMIGVTIMSHTFIKDAITISKAAKKKGIIVVWGGTVGSGIARAALENDFVDYVSYNEGEYTWRDMADAFDAGKPFDDIKGLCYMKNGEFVKTPMGDFIDLTTLPPLDWTLVDVSRYLQKSFGYDNLINIYYSKGCPNRCKYCYNPNYNRSTRRCRSMDVLLGEMKYLKENCNVGGFDFTDDVMFLTKKEAHDFCNRIIESGIDTCWSGYLGFGILNDYEDYELLYKAGCRSMIMGVESGSEKILRSVSKANKLDKVRSNIEMSVKAGIVPITMFIIGFPGETVEDLKKTVDFAKSLDGIAHSFAHYVPVPGSEQYKELVEAGKIKECETLDEYASVNPMERIVDNYTENIPDVDLITIKKYMRLRGFFLRTPGEKGIQTLRILDNTIRTWFRRGLKNFIMISYLSVYEMLSTLTIFLHPKIRKKYGLYFRK